MGIKRIETVENEFIEQLKQLLNSSFPEVLGFEVEYFIGEDKGIRGLYVEIKSKVFGIIYRKKEPMESYVLVSDIEEDFVNKVINDLVLGGISFLNGESVRQKQEKEMNRAIVDKKFKRIIPSRIIYMN